MEVLFTNFYSGGHLRALLVALSEGGVVHYNCLQGAVINPRGVGYCRCEMALC